MDSDSTCTLSLLPFHCEERVDGVTLPPRLPFICRMCWEGPFAMQFGLHCPGPAGYGRLYRQMGRSYSYSTTHAHLEDRATSGCTGCQFLLTVWVEYVRASSFAELEGLLEITLRGSTQEYEFWSPKFVQRIDVIVNGETVFTGLVHTTPEDPAAPYIFMRSPIRDVGSPRALSLARGCLEVCVDGHECCRSLTSSSPCLPTRLLDCTADRPRLVSTAGEHGEYLALSYVWGGDQIHKTTTSNVSAYEQGIVPCILPATIRDAIYVTRTLGFRWLWIDSLCIIQDSDEDKRNEIGRMHHIYRDSRLTIIAASAKAVTEGFLQDRPPPLRFSASAFNASAPRPSGDVVLPFVCPPYTPATSIPVGTSDGGADQQRVGTVYITAMPSRILTPEEWPYSYHLGLIGTRAWCMQEYLMSPRSLIFTFRTLQYRCLTSTQHVGNSLCDTYGEQRIPTSLFRDDTLAPPGSAEWDRVHIAWRGIVGDYSRRALSVASDKLVACAAIAEQFHRFLRTDYVAGLWSETLLSDLLWSRRWNDAYAPRPTLYRAPSWSWASVDGEVSWGGQWSKAFWEENALAKVGQCEVALEDVTLPFGQVAGGSLVLSGTLLPCMLRATDTTVEDRRHKIVLQSLECTKRQQGSKGARSNVPDRDEVGVGIERDLSGTATIDCEADVGSGNMWAIPLLLAEFSMNGIVVASVHSHPTSPDSARGRARFRRIGYFYFQVETFKEESKGSVKAARELGRALKDGDYPAVDIEIV